MGVVGVAIFAESILRPPHLWFVISNMIARLKRFSLAPTVRTRQLGKELWRDTSGRDTSKLSHRKSSWGSRWHD